MRHLYAATVHFTPETERVGFDGYYLYDRFHPSLFVAASDQSTALTDGQRRTQRLSFGASLLLERRALRNQTLSLSWRGEHRVDERDGQTESRRLAGLALNWALGSARRYPFTVAPVEGSTLSLGVETETPWLGSDVTLVKLSADATTHLRLAETRSVALRVGGATVVGARELTDVYAIGGFPSGALLDRDGIRPAVLRGFPDDARVGRHLLHANAELRFPLLHPQRGLWSIPAFVRHLHGAVFLDLGHAWSGSFDANDAALAVGAAIGVDAFVGHNLPITATAGVARGFGPEGCTRAYWRLGLAF
jgi:outer membrane protein assembly factor BamA